MEGLVSVGMEEEVCGQGTAGSPGGHAKEHWGGRQPSGQGTAGSPGAKPKSTGAEDSPVRVRAVCLALTGRQALDHVLLAPR